MHDTMTLQSSRPNMFKHVDHKKCRISSDLIIVKLDNSSQFEDVTAFKVLSHFLSKHIVNRQVTALTMIFIPA